MGPSIEELRERIRRERKQKEDFIRRKERHKPVKQTNSFNHKWKHKIKKQKTVQTERIKRIKFNQDRCNLYKQELKHNRTRAEFILYKKLKGHDVNFMFQKAFYTTDKLFIVDFFFPRSKGHSLVVEVDGKYHEDQVEYDRYRSEWLRKWRGCEVIRFTNEEVISDVDKVYEIISAKGIRFKKVKILLDQCNAI